jgi:hypothetical protein
LGCQQGGLGHGQRQWVITGVKGMLEKPLFLFAHGKYSIWHHLTSTEVAPCSTVLRFVAEKLFAVYVMLLSQLC